MINVETTCFTDEVPALVTDREEGPTQMRHNHTMQLRHNYPRQQRHNHPRQQRHNHPQEITPSDNTSSPFKIEARDRATAPSTKNPGTASRGGCLGGRCAKDGRGGGKGERQVVPQFAPQSAPPAYAVYTVQLVLYLV